MSKKSTPKTSPSYRHHKASGNAFVELNGKRKYLGRYNSQASRECYHRTLAEWEANGQTLVAACDEITVVEVISLYLKHAQVHYRKPSGEPAVEFGNIVRACRLLKKLYGTTRAHQFTPRDLKTLQNAWVRTAIARSTVNRYVSIVKRVFKWAASEGLSFANIRTCCCHCTYTLARLEFNDAQHRFQSPELGLQPARYRCTSGGRGPGSSSFKAMSRLMCSSCTSNTGPIPPPRLSWPPCIS